MAISKTVELLGPQPGNGAQPDIELEVPYRVSFTIEGICPLLFHRWSNEAVAEKANAKKGSKQKKTDNLESYVYRNHEGTLCLPGVYVHSAMQQAAKFEQDPRSPRKSAFDLFKAAVSPLTELASLGTDSWAGIDERRVLVQRNAVTRRRPMIREGWRASMDFLVSLPEYVSPELFLRVLTLAGRTVGVGDFRPTYGRFAVVGFERLELVS